MLLHGVYTGCGWELKTDDKTRERPYTRTNMTATGTIDAHARAHDTRYDRGNGRLPRWQANAGPDYFEPSTMENGE